MIKSLSLLASLLLAISHCGLLFCKNNSEYMTESLSAGCCDDDIESESIEYAESNSIEVQGNPIIPEYKSFMQAYFNELTQNIGNNQYGSCGYIALGMVLSYYDTFLSDNIIPEQYDVASIGNSYSIFHRDNSPGIRYDQINASNTDEYISALNSISDVSLHAKLVMYGKKRGYLTGKNESLCGTYAGERKNVLIDYLTGIGFVNGVDYNISLEYERGNAAYVTKIRSKIDSGLPVIVAIEGNKGAHAVVAYDYDLDANGKYEIYAHYGYKGNKETYLGLLGADYDKITSIMTVKFNMKHTHTNNYGVTQNGNITYYCSCDCRTGYNRKINHKYDYTYASDKRHSGICIFCGSFTSGAHQAKVGSDYTYNGHRYVICKLCDHAVCIDNNIIIGTL